MNKKEIINVLNNTKDFVKNVYELMYKWEWQYTAKDFEAKKYIKEIYDKYNIKDIKLKDLEVVDVILKEE